MKRRVGTSGFTIVEAMVVLAVTGFLFAAIVVTMAGRQSSNEFIQSINDVRTRLQQVITETQNGFYSNMGDLKCTGGAAVSFTQVAVGSVKQGENDACVFLGKIVQFSVASAPATQARVYPVAGLRTAANLATADPSVVSNGSVDESTTFDLKYGLKVAAMKENSINIGAFGVLSSLDSSTPGQSGDQQFDVFGIGNIGLNHAKLKDSDTLTLDRNPAGGIKICFVSAGTNQYGLITVGNNSGKLSVDLKIMGKSGLLTPCGI